MIVKILKKLNIPQPKGRAVTNIEDGVKAASEIGYPVLITARAGGGGRGIRLVNNESEIKKAFEN